MPDIDIDFADRTQILSKIKHIPASLISIRQAQFSNHLVDIKKHNTGIYCHEIPIHPVTNTASYETEEAERLGYFKIDFLNVSIYKDVKNEEHLVELMNKEPLWELLEQDDFSNLLFHVKGHGSILRQMKPKTIDQLAAVLAIIRPAKRYLIGKDWTTVMNEVWIKPSDNQYFFKKSHAIAYATAIVVQMNLICDNISYDYS